MSLHTTVNPVLATDMIMLALTAGLVPYMTGSPGIGKSSIYKDIAKNNNLFLIDMRLSQCDPIDLAGLLTLQNGKAKYVPLDSLPIETDTIPDGYAGWLLVLDEFSSANQAVQAASYKLVLDKMVGTLKLHPRVLIVCAGNLESDNAIVQPLSTALQSRFVHIKLGVSSKDWIDWAVDNGIHHTIISFLRFRPVNFYTFTPDHEDSTYACPRTWEFASKLLKKAELSNPVLRPLLEGTVSVPVAAEFLSYCKIYEQCPTVPQIIADPTKVIIPDSPSILFAVIGTIANNVTKENFKALMEYIVRLPLEFQVVCLKDINKRSPLMMQTPEVRSWLRINATELF